jgi:peptidoglycan-N-acetylglucosamine deacetylase
MKKLLLLSFLIGVAVLTTGCSNGSEKVCADNAGTWLPEHRECEYIPQDVCEEAGGKFQECGSACRHQEAKNGEVMACTMQCVQVCEFSDQSTSALIEEDTDNLTLKVEYPVTESNQLNKLIKDFVLKRVNVFKETIGEDVISENWKNGFYISFEIFAYDENIQTYKFDIVEFTGGAHDNLYFKTFTYDFENDKEIGFRDMFQEEHNPLDTIAPLAKEQLVEAVGDNSMLETGTDKDFENYTHFAPTGSELLLFFPPYQVAPWAAGPQTVKLAWDDINVVLQLPFFLGN